MKRPAPNRHRNGNHDSITSRNGTDTFAWGRTRRRHSPDSPSCLDGPARARLVFVAPFPWAHAPSPPPRLIGRGSWGLLGWQILVSRQRQPVTRRDPHCRLVARSLGFDANSSRDAGWPIPMAPSHATPPLAWAMSSAGGRPMWRWVGEGEIGVRWASAIPIPSPCSSLAASWDHTLSTWLDTAPA